MVLFTSPVVELLARSQSETPLGRVLVVMHHIALSCSFISAKGHREENSFGIVNLYQTESSLGSLMKCFESDLR